MMLQTQESIFGLPNMDSIVLSEQQTAELKQAFLLFDSDKKGVVSSKELRLVIESLGLLTATKLNKRCSHYRVANTSASRRAWSTYTKFRLP